MFDLHTENENSYCAGRLLLGATTAGNLPDLSRSSSAAHPLDCKMCESPLPLPILEQSRSSSEQCALSTSFWCSLTKL